MAAQAGLEPLVAALARVPIDSVDAFSNSAARIRTLISAGPIPVDLASAITAAYRRPGAGCAVAVRSSATAEDLPTASFAGMQESDLNLSGTDAVLDAVRRCWASLWTDRAVSYRARNRIPHTTVQLAVVVRRHVPGEKSGVLFTADMATGDRGVCSIEATYGLGEALVSGRVNPDTFPI